MTGLLLALCFATGVALLWLGAVGGVTLPAAPASLARVRVLLRDARLDTAPSAFLVASVGVAVLAAAVTWSLVAVPILAVVAAVGGAWAPSGWVRRRRDRNRRERERAWPAALSGIADALEAGVAFPAAVALAGERGPAALRPDWSAFHTRLRSAGLEAALDGLSGRGERSADTVAVLLRAGLLELPAGGLAPVLRDLAQMLSERFEAREKARSRAASLQLEAAILALSPIVLLLLVGLGSRAYLDAYRTPAGTAVGAVGGGLIYGCYLLMRRLGRVSEPRRTTAGGGRR
jgi:tight adherence protein B